MGGFPHGSDSKESACSVEDLSLIPGLGKSLEKKMATHSSILAWKIPRAEEHGGLWSMGSQRVGHDLVTNTTTFVLLCASNEKSEIEFFKNSLTVMPPNLKY